MSKTRIIKNRKFNMLLERSISSNVSKSTRRIFFTSVDEDIKTRGFYHADWFSGFGSGILVRYKSKFFLLTADHVIKNARPFQNISPFWIYSQSSKNPESMFGYMMPKSIWPVGGLINENTGIYDDVCLIELFDQPEHHVPDCYIDLDGKSAFLKQEHFELNLSLVAVGFSANKNGYEYTNVPKGFTHKTDVIRSIYLGTLQKDEHGYYVCFEKTYREMVKHDVLNGMSGCPIHTITKNKSNQVKLAGMALRAGEDKMRFLPSYLIEHIVKRYLKTQEEIVDAGHTIVDPMEAAIARMIYSSLYNPDQSKKEDIKNMLRIIKEYSSALRIDDKSPIFQQLQHID